MLKMNSKMKKILDSIKECTDSCISDKVEKMYKNIISKTKLVSDCVIYDSTNIDESKLNQECINQK